jgi:uncharacterized membrane protein
MRGLAVLIMIEAHLVDSWTGLPGRATPAFSWAMIVGGFGAPLFLLLAGLSVVLSAGSKFRRSNDARAASRAVVRRGFEIFLLAFLFRAQAWILGWAAPWTLLRVDILNIMGPCIMGAAIVWGAARPPRARAAAFLAVMLAFTLLTPLVRNSSPWLAALPDPIEAYIRPVEGFTNFAMFPWAAFVFAGALIGVPIEAARERRAETRVNVWLGGAGALLALGAYGASFLPTPYPRSEFWYSSPAFFFLRTGILAAGIAAAYAWEMRPGGRQAWSPMQQLGRTSLFIYWIHVEMVYGLISIPLHHALSLRQAMVSLALFTLFMLGCSLAKDRAVAWWTGGRGRLRLERV